MSTCYCDGTAHPHRRDYCGFIPTPHPDDMTENRRERVMSDQFCPHCGVSNDLHDGPDSCARAESKAQLIEMFGVIR